MRQVKIFEAGLLIIGSRGESWLKPTLGETASEVLHIQDSVRIAKHLEDKPDEFNRIDTARLEQLKEEFSRVHPETEIKILLEYDNPKELIPQYIRENGVTLAIMGSQGRGYISEFFLGSVSLRVARLADSNVVVIPAD
jgi:nucleotide-binding universal stress UspA family protein